MNHTAVYAGSFDPVTLGHMDLIKRASTIFPKVIVGIGVNSSKKSLFSNEGRKLILEQECKDAGLTNVEVKNFEGLLVRFCETEGARVIIRGLRALTDFEYELGIAHANSTQVSNVDTIFLATKPEFSFVSSSVVKEIAKHGGRLDQYVSKRVAKELHSVFCGD